LSIVNSVAKCEAQLNTDKSLSNQVAFCWLTQQILVANLNLLHEEIFLPHAKSQISWIPIEMQISKNLTI